MDKIVSIEERIESKKQKEQLKQHQGKISAIGKVVQCSSCHFRCAMCGIYLNETKSTSDSASLLGHPFCDGCRGEFEDFLSVSRDKKPSDIFWHNKEWKNMWSAWLNYQESITGFMNSPEYKLLLEDPDTQS